MPLLSANQAMAAAFTNMQVMSGQPLQVNGLKISLPDPFGVEVLTYSLTFMGILPGTVGSTEYSVTVDANTGNTLGSGIITGITPAKRSPLFDHFVSPKKVNLKKQSELQTQMLGVVKDRWRTRMIYSPLLVGGRPYLYVGYLGYGSHKKHIKYHASNKTVIFAGQDQTATFQVAAKRYTRNGQERQLTSPPLLVNNRCYVPLEVARGMMPFSVRYDAKACLVHFDSLPTVTQAVSLPTKGN
jgi:hypothetical protein